MKQSFKRGLTAKSRPHNDLQKPLNLEETAKRRAKIWGKLAAVVCGSCVIHIHRPPAIVLAPLS